MYELKTFQYHCMYSINMEIGNLNTIISLINKNFNFKLAI